jgi:hypothetical protein
MLTSLPTTNAKRFAQGSEAANQSIPVTPWIASPGIAMTFDLAV